MGKYRKKMVIYKPLRPRTDPSLTPTEETNPADTLPVGRYETYFQPIGSSKAATGSQAHG